MCEKKIENTGEKVLWTFEEWKKENDYLDLVEQIIQLPLPPLTKYAMIMTSLKIDAMMMRFYLDYYFKKTECHLDEGSKIIDFYQCVDTLIDPKVVEKIENTDVNIPWNFEEWQAENGDLMVDIHLDQHPLERDAMIMGLYLDYYFKTTEHCQCCQCFEPRVENGFNDNKDKVLLTQNE